jgi:nicotinate-nucleotide adenylyltransferase
MRAGGHRRTAVMGGTFNPPHLGHLVCAQEALTALELDSVVWIPVNTPPHKELPDDIGVHRRLELCRLAVAGEPRFSVSALEAARPGPSYTVDTLEALHAQSPGDELTFIVGGDMAHSLPAWRDPERVVRLAGLAVAERAGIGRREILERLSSIQGAVEAVRFFDMPRMDISSSLVRRRVAAGRPIRYLVPESVAQYIEQESLYRSSSKEVVG